MTPSTPHKYRVEGLPPEIRRVIDDYFREHDGRNLALLRDHLSALGERVSMGALRGYLERWRHARRAERVLDTASRTRALFSTGARR